jgi:hypothetical protein
MKSLELTMPVIPVRDNLRRSKCCKQKKTSLLSRGLANHNLLTSQTTRHNQAIHLLQDNNELACTLASLCPQLGALSIVLLARLLHCMVLSR